MLEPFAFDISIYVPQSKLSIFISWGFVLLLIWLFWRSIYFLLASVVIFLREFMMGNTGMYISCFLRYHARESGEYFQVKKFYYLSYGKSIPRKTTYCLSGPDLLSGLIDLVRRIANKKGIPFKNLSSENKVSDRGIVILHSLWKRRLKIIFTWKDEKGLQLKEIDLPPDKNIDVSFSDQYQLCLIANQSNGGM